MSSREQYKEYNKKLREDLRDERLKNSRLIESFNIAKLEMNRMKQSTYDATSAMYDMRVALKKTRKRAWTYYMIAFILGAFALLTISYIRLSLK